MANEILATDLDAYEEDTTPLPPDYDEDADSYAAPPPLPDGTYLAELSLGGVKDAEGNKVEMVEVLWTGDTQPYPWMSIQAKIIDPGGKQDGKFASDGLVRSKGDRNGANPVDAIYRAITGQPTPGASLKARAAALVKELRSKPIVKITTQLQGVAQEADNAFKARKKAADAAKVPRPKDGPKKFKGDAAFTVEGKLQGSVIDPDNNEPVIARASIVRYAQNK